MQLFAFIRAEGLIPRRFSATLCVVTKGIKADCNHLVKNIHPCTFLTASFLQSKKLVSVWNHRHPCRIAHTVRNVEHCFMHVLFSYCITGMK